MIKIKRILGGLMVSLGLLSALALVAPTQAAQAATTCVMSGTLGNPRLNNLGPVNPVVVRQGTVQNNIYIGDNDYFCAGAVYVHNGYDVEIQCENGVVYYRTEWGWQSLLAHGSTSNYWPCSLSGGSLWVKFREYRQ